MLTIAPLCLLLCLFTMSYQAGAEHDEKAIRGLIDSFIDAWNRHDAHAFWTLFAEDADFTNWRGMGAKGRSKIEEFHAPIFATIFRNSHLGYTDSEIRFIRADVAAVTRILGTSADGRGIVVIAHVGQHGGLPVEKLPVLLGDYAEEHGLDRQRVPAGRGGQGPEARRRYSGAIRCNPPRARPFVAAIASSIRSGP